MKIKNQQRDADSEMPSAPCGPAPVRKLSLVETAPSTTSSTHDDEHEQHETNPKSHDHTCLLGKWILILVNMAALFSSIFATISCRFFAIHDLPDSADHPLLEGVASDATSLGVFGYSSSTVNDSPIDYYVHSCVSYEAQFWNSPVGPFLVVAQFAAFLAPCVGGIACLVQLLEVACPSTARTIPSFYPSVVLFGLGTLLQGTTFVIYGDVNFCIIDNEYECELAEAGYVSVAAIGLYYICLIFTCCLPRTRFDKGADGTTAAAIDNDDARSLGGVSRKSRSRSVHFWDEE